MIEVQLALENGVDTHHVEVFRYAGKNEDGSAILEPTLDTQRVGLYLRRRTLGEDMEQCFGQRLADGSWAPLYHYEVLRILNLLEPGWQL